MNRCKKCIMPDTRPDAVFVDGVCPACITHEKRKDIYWAVRKDDLIKLLESNRSDSGYDCIVPSSGGKDSTAQVMYLKELGVNPLVVTASTCHLTEIGRHNIENLKRHADTIEVSPNKQVRARLNKIGLEMVGDISLPEHWAIFTIPFKVAVDMGIPMIFYGENPQAEYSGPPGTEKAAQMTRRWRSEFGGFLGLRPEDMIQHGFTRKDMEPYTLPPQDEIEGKGISAYFLGHYIKWDAHKNAEIAIKAGLQYKRPWYSNYWEWENLDNAQTGMHDYFMFLKYGFGRACTQLSVDIRNGRISRDDALNVCLSSDGAYPYYYADIRYDEMLEMAGITRDELYNSIVKFINNDNYTMFREEKSARVEQTWNSLAKG